MAGRIGNHLINIAGGAALGIGIGSFSSGIKSVRDENLQKEGLGGMERFAYGALNSEAMVKGAALGAFGGGIAGRQFREGFSTGLGRGKSGEFFGAASPEGYSTMGFIDKGEHALSALTRTSGNRIQQGIDTAGRTAGFAAAAPIGAAKGISSFIKEQGDSLPSVKHQSMLRNLSKENPALAKSISEHHDNVILANKQGRGIEKFIPQAVGVGALMGFAGLSGKAAFDLATFQSHDLRHPGHQFGSGKDIMQAQSQQEAIYASSIIAHDPYAAQMRDLDERYAIPGAGMSQPAGIGLMPGMYGDGGNLVFNMHNSR